MSGLRYLRNFVIVVFIILFSVCPAYAEEGRSLTYEAYYNLGMQYQAEARSLADIEKAGEMFGRSAASGYLPAIKYLEDGLHQCLQGTAMVKEGASNHNDNIKILSPCILIASSGDIKTQFHLGILYLSGLIDKTNKENGVRWLTAAAKQGHIMAQYELVREYLKGGMRADKAGNISTAYGWACVLQKQISVSNSPGMDMWTDPKMNFGKNFEEIKRNLELMKGKAPHRISSKMGEACKDFVKSYYHSFL